MPLTASSSTWVMRDSTTAADAPVYVVVTDTTGGSMFGNSRSGSRVKAIVPSTISSRLATVARTGRRIDRSEMTTGQRRPGLDCGFSPASLTTEPSCSFTMPSTTMRSPAWMPSRISTLPGLRAPSFTGVSATLLPSPTR